MKDTFSTTIDNTYPKSKSEINECLQDENINIINRSLTSDDAGIAALEKG